MSKAGEKSTQAIIEAANEWLLIMHEDRVGAADEQAFVAWLRESPVHVREYLRAEAVFAAMEGVDPEKRIDVEALVAAGDDTVVELAALQDIAQSPAIASKRHRRRTARLWAAAAGVLLAVITAFWYAGLPQADVYMTGLGEQRRLVLEDGSVIDMNTQSKLTVHMTDVLRSIDLIDGEALFTVARDGARPFVVASEHATVRALGTQFNVQKRDGQVLVTVLEGRVAVAHTAPPDSKSGAIGAVNQTPVELGAGDAAEVAAAVPIKTITKVNTESTVAWTERRLIFDDEPLSGVVAEFNRYNARQLMIDDPDLARQRISAVFDADQPDALLRFLEQNAGVVVDTRESVLVIQAKE